MAKTGRKSRIVAELDPDLREELDARIADGRLTIDALRGWLAQHGHDDISRSGVARYVASKEDVFARLRESRAIAEAMRLQLGPDGEESSRNAQLVEMLQALLHSGMMRLIADPEAEVGPGDLAKLAKAIQSASSAQKLDVERRLKDAQMRAANEAAQAALEKAAAAVKTAAIAKGVSQETVDQIYHAVLGVDYTVVEDAPS